MTDVNLTGEAREAYMEAIAKKSVNLTEDERMAFMDALMRESAQATEAKQNRVYSQRGDDYLIEAQRLCAEAAMQRWNGSREEIAVEPKYKYWPVKISRIEMRW